MLKVVHFDNAREISKEVRDRLAVQLNPLRVEYQDLTENPKYDTFASLMGDLEKTLDQKDVLLVHPELKTYGPVMDYPRKFPNLKVILLLPGDQAIYEEKRGMKLYTYPCINDLIDFLNELGTKKE
jgi:hypothetical protein